MSKKKIEELELEKYTCSTCETSENEEWVKLRNERNVFEGQLERATDEVNDLRPWIEELIIKEINLEKRITQLSELLNVAVEALEKVKKSVRSEFGVRTFDDNFLYVNDAIESYSKFKRD